MDQEGQTREDQALSEVRRRLVTAAVAVIVVFAVGVIGYTIISKGQHRFLDALYMTVITLTTVGYGEIIPLENNPAGRIFTMVLLLFGMGVLVYFASTVTAFIVEGQLGQVFWRKRMRQAIAELKEHIVVCGDRTIAGHVVDEMRRIKRPVVAVVPSGSAPPPLTTEGELLYVEGDPADEDVLRSAGIMRAAGVVAAMESDRENVLIVLTAKQTNPILRVVSMVIEARNEAKMRRAGADAVVSVSRIGGLRVASEMIRPTVASFLDQMLRDRERNLRIEEIPIGRGSSAIGRTLAELRINDVAGVLLLALVEPDGTTYQFKPDGAQRLKERQTLIVMGGPEAVGDLKRRYGGDLYAEAAKTTLERPAPGRG
jgi:voltage-gated potassium channel